MAEVNLTLPNGASGTDGTSAANYGGTSATSLTIGTGSKTFTTQANLAYRAGARVRAASAGATANYMEGVITSYSSTTLILNVDKIGGSGTLSDWSFNIAGQPGDTGATGAAGTNGTGYYATSTTSLAIGTGSKTFTTQSGLAYAASMRVRVANSATAYMEGTVTSYSSTTLVLNIDRTVGSGTFAVWTIGLTGDIASFTDTGWLEVSGFSHMPSADRPQYRVLNKQISFRGTGIIPLSTDTGATTTGLVLEAYTGESDYAASTGQVVPYQGSGGVTVNNDGAIYFNNQTAAISSSYFPNTTYVKEVIGFRRVQSSSATREMTYTGHFTLSISSGGILTLATLKDTEQYTGTDLGHSPLRAITSNVVSGDYVTFNNTAESVGAVSQATNITTGVTLARRKGVITTQTATAAADASQTFTVTNTTGDANAFLVASIINYSGTFSTNGIPVLNIDNRGSGVFDIVISNAHAANALNGTLVIAYELINTQATITHQVTLNAAEPYQIGGFMIKFDGLTAYIT